MAMGYLEVIFFIPFFLMPLLAVAQNQNSTAESLLFPKQYCILQRGNYTDNSTYQADLDGLLSSFSNTTVDFGFYNSSAGEVNAMGLCRADLTPDSCRTCINSSVHVLRRSCPNYKEAIIYNRTCMLRYSDRSIFGIWESNPLLITFTFRHFTNVSQTKPIVLKLLTHLYDEAASGGPLRKYAVGEAVSEFESIYALVQCTPNLPKQKCRDCLEDLHEAVPYRFERSGLFLIGPSCNFRYASFRFYQSVSDGPSSSPSPSSSLSPSPSPSPTPTTNDTTGNGKNKRRSIIIAAVSTVASVVLIFCICVCIYIFIFSKVEKSKEQDEDMGEIMSIESLQLDLNSVKVATDNFSDANKLGQGGFGDVYKGKLPNGQDIVVKSLSKDSRQGELEFKNEVLLVAKLQHRNLVRLLGFCLEGTEKILIYEFVPNASLDQFIFDPIKSSQLNWQRRYKIIEGIARGLVYLHEDSRVQIIHRDLKASNILLDEEMSPKISDFGMARIFLTDQTQDTTRRVVGSNGYMAPEYAMNGKFSSKSDVYSFGVLTLEIVSGQKNSSSQNGEDIEDLLNFAWKSWSMGTISNFIDPVLRSSLRSEAVARCIQIALLCVQENVVDRPTMASVILMLSSDSLPLPTPSRPSLFMSHSIQQESSIVGV